MWPVKLFPDHSYCIALVVSNRTSPTLKKRKKIIALGVKYSTSGGWMAVNYLRLKVNRGTISKGPVYQSTGLPFQIRNDAWGRHWESTFVTIAPQWLESGIFSEMKTFPGCFTGGIYQRNSFPLSNLQSLENLSRQPCLELVQLLAMKWRWTSCAGIVSPKSSSGRGQVEKWISDRS